MTLPEMRRGMTRYYEDAQLDARFHKDPMVVQELMKRLYSQFDDTERPLAHDVLAEWVVSYDDDLRSHALALINALKIVSALESLKFLAIRLKESTAAAAPYELQTVQRVIRALSAIKRV